MGSSETMNIFSSFLVISFIIVVINESLKCVLTIEKNANFVKGFIVLDKSSSETKFLWINKSSSSRNESQSCGWFFIWSNNIENTYDEQLLICLMIIFLNL